MEANLCQINQTSAFVGKISIELQNLELYAVEIVPVCSIVHLILTIKNRIVYAITAYHNKLRETLQKIQL
jgi:hypothetical protein